MSAIVQEWKNVRLPLTGEMALWAFDSARVEDLRFQGMLFEICENVAHRGLPLRTTCSALPSLSRNRKPTKPYICTH